MNVEEQLRRTLDDAAHRLPDHPGDMDAAIAEGERRRRRTRAGAVVAGVASVAVAVAAVGLNLLDLPGGGSFPIEPVDPDVAEQPSNEEGPGDGTPGDEAPGDDAPGEGALPTDQPILILTAGEGWSVRVTSDGGDGWCVSVRRGAGDPAEPAADGATCDRIAAPGAGNGGETFSPVRTEADGDAELLFGSVDPRAEEVAVIFRDGERSTATGAGHDRLPFGIWALPRDGRIPVRVEALRADEVIGARDLDDWTGAGPTATADDEALIAELLRFASEPTEAGTGTLPFADEVALGLADEIITTRRVDELADPEAWWLDVEHFRAYVGPFSALDLAAGSSPADTVVSVGDHPHCASPPVAAPAAFADHRRVSVQPDPGTVTSCLQWWTVDLYLDGAGRIDAVTLDLYEP